MNVLFVPDDGSPALPVLVGGEPENVDEVRATEILSEGKFEIKIQLGIGEESAKYWTCDFSYVSLSFLFSLFFADPLSERKKKVSTGNIFGCRRVIYLPLHFTLASLFPTSNYLYVTFTLVGTESFHIFPPLPIFF